MVNFDLDSVNLGERFQAMDLTIAYSSEKKTCRERLLTPEEYIRNEIKNLSAKERERNLMTFYHYDGFCYHTFDNELMIRLSLARQSSICSPHCKLIKKCIFCATYYRKGKKWLPLWRTRSFEFGYKPEYLNAKMLIQKLRLIFKDFTIKLGEFREKEVTGVKFIAWQVTTNKGEVYYIPWHNGALVPALPEYVFEEKDLVSMRRNTYSVLRFGVIYDGVEKGSYRVVCC